MGFSEEVLSIVLEDDETPTGGTAFLGETVRDFVSEFHFNNVEELNVALKECGIKPIVA